MVLVVTADRARELVPFELIWVKICFRLLLRPVVSVLSASSLFEGIVVEKVKATLGYLRGKC